MIQNGNIPYPNMIPYPMNFQSRSIDSSKLIQYTFQQAQAPRMYPVLLNNNIPKPQPQIQSIYNANSINPINPCISNTIISRSNSIQDNSLLKKDTNEIQNSSPKVKLLTKYKDIYVPSIYLLDYNDTSKSPFNIIIANSNQNQTQSYHQITGQIINNNQSNNVINKYLNYGYNFEQWKAYVKIIRSKFDELNDLVKNGNIRLPDPDNELEYLLAFPSDYGGLGNVQNDQFYENVKFYDPKDTTKNNPNKNFMSLIKFEHDQIWFPLEPNPLNKKINDINKIINSSVNPYLKYYIPQNNFFIRNPNTTIVSNSEIKNNGDNSNKSENDQNKKER